MDLEKRIKEQSAKIGVIGLGYVGLPLAVEYADKGFTVIGIDTDERKVSKINSAINYIEDVEDENIPEFLRKK